MKILGEVLDRESYDWLSSHQPDIVEAIEREVANGASPRDVWLFVMRQTGRDELAARCLAAARYVAREAGK